MSSITITTRYQGPTNVRGARIVARSSHSDPWKVSVPYNHNVHSEVDAHIEALKEFCKHYGIKIDEFIIGGAPRPDRYVFIPSNSERCTI